MNTYFTIIFTLTTLLFAACSDSDDGNSSSPNTTATYQVTFTSLWNATDHVSVPSNAHYSPLVFATHNSNYKLFSTGELVTSGFEELAEMGVNTSIVGELDAEKAAGSIFSHTVESDLFLSAGSTLSFQVTVAQSHPLLSFASMIAPSPDWVIGINSLELYNSIDGFLSDSGEINLFAYDAGTEEGDTGGNFSINNTATSPPNTMSRLSGTGFATPFAKIQFVLVN